MKLETIVKRYKNLGYEPKFLDRDLETASIIKWIYEKYDIYIDVIYCSLKTAHYKKFTGYHRWNCKQDYNESFYCDKHFDNPFDAKFDAIVNIYSSIKFNF
jgi:hypothetical protein